MYTDSDSRHYLKVIVHVKNQTLPFVMYDFHVVMQEPSISIHLVPTTGRLLLYLNDQETKGPEWLKYLTSA